MNKPPYPTEDTPALPAQDPEDTALHSPCRPLGAFPNGLLPVAVADQDLKVEIDRFNSLRPEHKIQLLWKDQPYGAVHVVNQAEFDDPDVIFTLTVSSDELKEQGVSSLNYRTQSPGGNVGFGDPPWQIRVDRTPPGGNAMAALNFLSVISPVTPDKLDTQNRLPAQVHSYEGKQTSDLIHPRMRRVDDGREVQGTTVRVLPGDMSQPVTVYFTHEQLLAIGDGDVHFTYTLEDRAGNVSNEAPVVLLTLLLNTVPTTLDPPEIPLYDQHGLINEEVARTPVSVLIPTYEHVAQGDLIFLSWGNVPLPARPILDPTANPLLRIPVPYATVQAGGNRSLDVTYEVRRDGVPLGTSPAKTVVVDISLPGGLDPDPEDPWHGNLIPATAVGASNVPNVISFADQDEPATVFVEWFGVDGSEVFQALDSVVAHWGSVTLAAHTVTVGEVGLKDPLELTISSEQIKQAGIGDLDLHYTVTRALADHPGHSNTAYSPVQVIRVLSGAELPGGGDPLPAGEYPERNLHNTINKAAAEDGTPFRIFLDYLNAAVGDQIDFEFHGHEGFGPVGTPIPDAFLAASHTVEQADLVPDPDPEINRPWFAFTVERRNLVAVQRGSGVGHYWVANSAGRVKAIVCQVSIETLDLEP